MCCFVDCLSFSCHCLGFINKTKGVLIYSKALAVSGNTWIDCFSYRIIALELTSSKNIALHNVSASSDIKVYAHM